MSKWQYDTEILTSLIGRDKLRLDDLNSTLRKRGEAGWELVNLDIRADVKGNRDGHLLIFKRQIAGEQVADPQVASVTDAFPTPETDDGGPYDVRLMVVGKNTIQVIKIIKTATGLGLKESKDLMDGVKHGTPASVRMYDEHEDAKALAQKFMEAGASVEIT